MNIKKTYLFLTLLVLLSGCGEGSSNSGIGSVKAWTYLSAPIGVVEQDAWPSQVAMDNKGNAIIIWEQFNGINNQIYMSEYRSGQWNHPTDLISDAISIAGQDAWTPYVAMDDNGNAIIAWGQSDGTNTQIYVSEYRNGQWNHPTDLTTSAISISGQFAWMPNVCMDNNDNAVISWVQNDGTTNQIYKSEYRNGSWNHPTDLGTDAISIRGQFSSYPYVAMDNNGNTIITWSQSNGTEDQIYKSEYRNGSWIHPLDLIADAISIEERNFSDPKVVMDDNGNSIIVWYQSDGTNSRIYMSEYRNGSWSHPTDLLSGAISAAAENAYSPDVAMDNDGNAVIAWKQSDGTEDQIYKSEYRNGSWIYPKDLFADSISLSGQAFDPKVAMDDNGNTIIVWGQVTGSFSNQVYKSEYRNGAWIHPADTVTDAIGIAGQLAYGYQVAMDDNDNTIVIWGQWDGITRKIFMSEYR